MKQDNRLLKDFVTKQEVAQMFGVTTRTVDRWVRLRQIPAPLKIGRQRLWHLPTVEKLLAEEAA
jgi:excisionase family DNA binding protein